jgi:hypothetical protein
MQVLIESCYCTVRGWVSEVQHLGAERERRISIFSHSPHRWRKEVSLQDGGLVPKIRNGLECGTGRGGMGFGFVQRLANSDGVLDGRQKKSCEVRCQKLPVVQATGYQWQTGQLGQPGSRQQASLFTLEQPIAWPIFSSYRHRLKAPKAV